MGARSTAAPGNPVRHPWDSGMPTGSWQKLVDVPAPVVTGLLGAFDPDTASFPACYDRLVSPVQP
jgi:hypothetical protein